MNKKECEHYNKVASLGCIACLQIGYEDTPCEIHHIRAGTGLGQRSSFNEVIPLCPQHHRHGSDSIHRSKKNFVEKFGTERDLLEKVMDMI